MYITNSFSILLLAILLFHLIGKKKHLTSSGRFFMFLLASSMLVLLFEIFSWTFDTFEGPGYRQLNIAFNFVFFLLNVIVPVCWLLYIDFKIYASFERLKKRLYYFPYIGFALIGLIINLFYPWLYKIDDANVYSRQWGAIIFTIYIFLIIYSSILFSSTPHTSFSKNVRKAFVYFTLFPVAGAVAQLLIPGSLLVWNAVALGILGSFTSLELFDVSHDFLTGLTNRRQFTELLEYKLYTAKNKSERFCVVMIDLDDFKTINDTYGHVAGDDALIIFSNILRTSCKTRDHVARFAGDEFIILLEGSGNEGITSFVKRIQTSLEVFNKKGIKPYDLKCSAAGIEYKPQLHISAKDILHDADSRMYDKKKQRKTPIS